MSCAISRCHGDDNTLSGLRCWCRKPRRRDRRSGWRTARLRCSRWSRLKPTYQRYHTDRRHVPRSVTVSPQGINLCHHIWHFKPRGVVITNHTATTTPEHTLRSTSILIPRDERHAIIADLMLLELREIERVCGSDPGVFRIPMVSVGCHSFWIDGDDHVLMFTTAGATWVRALIASGIDAGE